MMEIMVRGIILLNQVGAIIGYVARRNRKIGKVSGSVRDAVKKPAPMKQQTAITDLKLNLAIPQIP